MDTRHRWLTPFGVAVVGVVVVANAAGEVGFAASGSGLLIVVGSAFFVVSGLVFLLWQRAPRPVVSASLLVLAGGAVAVHHGDPSGPVVGLFLVMAFAPFRLERRSAVVVAVVVAAAFNVEQALTVPNPAVFVLVTDMGAAFFFLVGTLLRGEREQRARAEGLLAELERQRDAERAAAELVERSRIAREMHDVLAHTLSGLVLQLEGARLLGRSKGVDEQVQTVIERAYGIARGGLGEAHRAIGALRGDAVPGPEQLETLVEEHRRTAGGSCRLVVEGEPRSLDPQARHTLYRAAQEALVNVRKHAPGAPVEVRLAWSADSATLTVENAANGQPTRGTEAAHGAPGYGLTGMAERAQLLGGHLSAGRRGDGFRVELCVPLGGGS